MHYYYSSWHFSEFKNSVQYEVFEGCPYGIRFDYILQKYKYFIFLVAARVTAELVVGNVDKLGDNRILEGWLGW